MRCWIERAWLIPLIVVASSMLRGNGAIGDDVQPEAGSGSADVRLEQVLVGLDGFAKPGVWTRLRASVKGTSSVPLRLEVVAADAAGHPVVYPGVDELKPGSIASDVDVFFAPGRLDAHVLVRLIRSDDRSVVASRRVSAAGSETADFRVLSHETPLWLTVGRIPGAQELISGLSGKRPEHIPHLTSLDSGAEFPQNWKTLAPYSTVFLAGKFDLNADAARTLRRWVQSGGRLIVAIGTRQAALHESPLAEWVLKDRTLQETSLSDLSGLEEFATSKTRVPVASRIRGTIIQQKDGSVLVPSIDGNLLTRSAYGFGLITLVGVDLDRPPVSRWRSLDRFLLALADVKEDQTRASRGLDRISRSGVTDLATQLHGALEHFPEVRDRSTLTVLGLLVLYLALIGPLDYLLVHKLLGKPRLTWITLPVGLIGMAMMTSALANGRNADELLVRQMELLDVDAATSTVRHTVFGTIYSPDNRRCEVELRHTAPASVVSDPQSANAGMLWFASPEAAFGGLYRPGGIEFGRPEYRFSEHGTIANLPLRTWSDRTLHSSLIGDSPANLIAADFKQAGTSQMTSNSGFTHHLPGPIDDWLVVHGTRVYMPRIAGGALMSDIRIHPGQRWEFGGETVSGRELRGFLTGTTFQRNEKYRAGDGGGDYSVSQIPWDNRNRDVLSVVRMLSLHNLAGGAAYTKLSNALLRTLEMTDCLPLDRAVLIGRLDASVAETKINGKTMPPEHQDVIVRILFPVSDAPVDKVLPKFERN